MTARPGVLSDALARSGFSRRRVNLAGTAAALRVLPPPVVWPNEPPQYPVTYGTPRTLLFVTVKRDNSCWRELYGHWWLEADQESYGWWPRAVPLGFLGLARGTGGILNGMGLLDRPGSWSRDSRHGDASAHAFHPVLTLPLSDDEVRTRLREFAHSYEGVWRWNWRPGGQHRTCRTFQDDQLRAAGLQEPTEHRASRGSGCPFLYRPRVTLWWLLALGDVIKAPRWFMAAQKASAHTT